ncbi:uncharacterized protein [Triticum aestivum]|nr:uncharacterized protein LOC123055103 isoform X2 [Triticum aestivum]
MAAAYFHGHILSSRTRSSAARLRPPLPPISHLVHMRPPPHPSPVPRLDGLYRRSAFTNACHHIPPPSAQTLHRTPRGSPSMRCRRLVLPTADLGSLRSQIQQAAASSSDVTAAVSSSPFSPRPWCWPLLACAYRNSMRIKKLSRSLGTLHLVVSSASSLPYSFSIVMEKPQDPSEEKKG